MYGRWAFLASVVAFIVIVTGRALFGTSSEDELAEFHAKYPTKDTCISGAAERLAPCKSPNCEGVVYRFFLQCVDQADGDKEEFCANQDFQQDSLGRDIFETHCKPHSDYQSECDKILGFTNNYCSLLL